MTDTWQRRFVLLASLGLSMLLLGGLASGWAVWNRWQEQVRDPEFLRQQLDRLGPQQNAAAERPPALVRVSVAQRKVVQPERPLVGRLIEVHKVTVAGEVAGKIVELPVEEGTEVTGSQTVLARVDDAWCRLALSRSKAQLATIQAQLEFERAELERNEQLSRNNVVTQSELESRRAKVSELEARLAETQVAVEEESERISRSLIRAPFDGTVVQKLAELGAYVAVGDPIVEVVSRGQVDARLMVPESLINSMALDQVQPVRIDALDETFPGTVVSVTPYGPTASRTFPVRVRLDDQGGRLKVGMSVTALIADGPRREALVVSQDAVLVRPDGSTIWVATPEDNAGHAVVEPVPVAISARMQNDYAVDPETEDGRQRLTAGALVVIEGAERLMAGQRVRMVQLGPAAKAHETAQR